MFYDQFEGKVVYDPADQLVDRRVRHRPKRQPDLTFGLRRTTAIKELIKSPSRRDLRHSPFEQHNCLYPFLVIEAKSEKGGPGFESIENQSAFPLQTMVKLQNDLKIQSDCDMNPLVWFLANQGDEWRVYASILDGSIYVCNTYSIPHERGHRLFYPADEANSVSFPESNRSMAR